MDSQPIAVHTSQLTNENLAILHRDGFTILPDMSGWLLFVRQQGRPDRASSNGGAPADASLPQNEPAQHHSET